MSRLLVFSFLFSLSIPLQAQITVDNYGAITRSDSMQSTIYLCFTGHDQVEGFDDVLRVLNGLTSKGNFFLTGDFIRNNPNLVREIIDEGHFVGAHSDRHLLYNDWEKRDSLLLTPNLIRNDIMDNVRELEMMGIYPKIFMQPYEWYNAATVEIAARLGQTTVNFTPGTRSNADYTTPDMVNYISSEDILTSIYQYESSHGMNGFHLLIHPGTDPKRKDKFYKMLENLIMELKQKGYDFDSF